ncbi:MAG: hypothetical protein WC676_02405 [Candidatus Omnitrophota bacterium]
MLKRLRSQKGIFLSLIAYPVFTLLVGLSVAVFIRSTNSSSQARALYNETRAEYNAIKGIEYASLEIKKQNWGTTQSFLTHAVANDGSFALSTLATPPEAQVTGARIENGNYVLGNASDGFQVKVYRYGDEVYMLSQGTLGSQTKLFINKIAGTSLYNYLGFYPGNVLFSGTLWDARGGKIHANGNIEFRASAVMNNVNELSASGNVRMNYEWREIHPNDLAIVGRYPWMFWPFKRPNNFPSPYNPEDPAYSAIAKDYRNGIHGYYEGARAGLLMSNLVEDGGNYDGSSPTCNTPTAGSSSCKFVPWDATPLDPDGTREPIYPWGNPATAPQAGPWNIDDGDQSYVYMQKNVNCLVGSNCASHLNPDNQASFYDSAIKINGIKIPPRFVGHTYDEFRYYRKYNEGDTKMAIDLTNAKEQTDAWNNYIESFPADINLEEGVITGLYDEDSSRPIVQFESPMITPPNIDTDALIAIAKDSNEGMSIESNDLGQIIVTVNGVQRATLSYLEDPENPGGTTAACEDDGNFTIFTPKMFVNHKSGKMNTAVEIDIGNLMRCEQIAGNIGKWLPSNGLLYSEESIALANAKKIPVGGLTSIVEGNLILKGTYNHPDDEADWAPSASIVSNKIYLASDGFNYPTSLPYPQRHPEYPYSRTYGSVTVPANNIGFVAGQYNWVYDHDFDGNSSVPAAQRMPNRVKKLVNGELQPMVNGETIYYDISLVGKYVRSIDHLEQWGFHANVGDINTAPSQWSRVYATIIGANIELSNEFPASGPVDGTNWRECDQSGYSASQRITPPSYCRSTYPQSDSLSWASSPTRIYQERYRTDTIRPPGDYMGLYQAALLEIPFTEQNWTHHYQGLS